MSIQEADYNITDSAFQGASGRTAHDDVLAVRFFTKPKENASKTAQEGRVIYEDTDYIEIRQPGNKDNVIVRPATEMDIARFPMHYQKYKARISQDTVVGTPLTEWPMITRSQAEELSFLSIFTVEQLAAVADVHAQNVMGINSLKQKAKDFLESKDELSERLEAALERLAELEAREQQRDAPKRRGRKPKAKEPSLEQE